MIRSFFITQWLVALTTTVNEFVIGLKRYKYFLGPTIVCSILMVAWSENAFQILKICLLAEHHWTFRVVYMSSRLSVYQLNAAEHKSINWSLYFESPLETKSLVDVLRRDGHNITCGY